MAALRTCEVYVTRGNRSLKEELICYFIVEYKTKSWLCEICI
jgi:hypothetical protein